jgi:hypothetical protein
MSCITYFVLLICLTWDHLLNEYITNGKILIFSITVSTEYMSQAFPETTHSSLHFNWTKEYKEDSWSSEWLALLFHMWGRLCLFPQPYLTIRSSCFYLYPFQFISLCHLPVEKKTTKLRGLSPRANYTDWAPSLIGQVSAKFCGLREPRGQRDRSLQPYSRFSRPELLNCTHEAEWTPLRTHYLSENLVALGAEPWPLDL